MLEEKNPLEEQEETPVNEEETSETSVDENDDEDTENTSDEDEVISFAASRMSINFPGMAIANPMWSIPLRPARPVIW